MSAQVLDVLVVGCGRMGGGYDTATRAGEPPLSHAGAYSEHGGFRLVACVDPDAAAREAFMRRWKVPRGHATLDEAGPADVISICSPTSLHARHLEQALRLKPRLVFCEKPLADSLEDAELWTRRCREAEVLLAVNHTRRWAPDVQRLREELAAGTWGRLLAITGYYTRGVLNNGSHLLDLVQFLVGPLRVIAAASPVADHTDGDPSVPALLQAGEVAVQLSVADARAFSLFELTIVTSAAMITMEAGGLRWSLRRIEDSPLYGGYRVLGEAKNRGGEYSLALRAAIANLHNALTRGAPLHSTGETALDAHRLCTQIMQFARKEAP